MNRGYKGVIFDFNGTLFFDNDKHILAWGEISKILRGQGITEEELLEHFNGVPNQKIVSYLLGREGTEEELKKYSELKEKKIPFTIASASIKANIDFFVKEFNLEKWIRPEDIVYDDGSYENKVVMFLDAAANIKIDIKDCMIVEDSISGIQSGYTAGCRNIVVIDSAGKAEEYRTLPGVVEIIRDYK